MPCWPRWHCREATSRRVRRTAGLRAERELVELPAAELARAARVLAVRSRREARDAFIGAYRSAFRGGGLEFEELRPYVPGDDLRSIDWNATARAGEPFVKRFREERDQALLLLLDVSASMRFGSGGRSLAGAAAHAAALLAASAAGAGDRVGLVAFDVAVREEVPPGRGEAHALRIVRAALAAARASGGATGLRAALEHARRRERGRRRAIVFLLSDLRDEALLAPEPERRGAASPYPALSALAARHDLVSVVLHDPRDEEIPAVGSVRLADPERGGRTLLLRTGSAAARARYRAAAGARREALERRLRAAGSDVLWLRADRHPLPALQRFFAARSARPPRRR